MPDTLLKIKNSEILARFLVYKRWIRVDNTIRPDAFMPPSDLKLSVTRHIGLSDSNIWQIGNEVAKRRSLPLLGRADFQVTVVKKQKLSAVAEPLTENPNHANITGWPDEKSSQKIKAMEIAKETNFIPSP